MRPLRRELIAVVFAALLVAAAFLISRLHWGTVTPLINSTPKQIRDLAQTAPIFGWWDAHVGWGTPAALLIGLAAVWWGGAIARRLPWRAVPWVTWTTACAWAFSLAMIDGWQQGFAGRLTEEHEYLRQVPSITDIPTAVQTFTTRILDFQPNSWITHVSGHPPGALLTFVWLDRIGLHRGAWAGLLCLLVGSSAAAAIVIAARVLADESTARRAAPFVAVAPTAIWVAVSADGYFAGVAAWGITLLAIAVRGGRRLPAAYAAGAGLLLGWGLFLNYGLGLISVLAAAVLASAPRITTAMRALIAAALTGLVVMASFVVAGFWWFDGYSLVQQRYWQGIAMNRPFQYWWWANFASVVCAIGLGSVAGVARTFDVAAFKRRSGLHLVIAAALVAIVCADLSMLSKAETERIWLPFTMWLTAAGAFLPVRAQRWWLALDVVGALVLNHFIMTNW